MRVMILVWRVAVVILAWILTASVLAALGWLLAKAVIGVAP